MTDAEKPSELEAVTMTPDTTEAGFLRALHIGHKLMADGTLDPSRCLAEADLDIEQAPMRCTNLAGHTGFHQAGRGPGAVAW